MSKIMILPNYLSGSKLERLIMKHPKNSQPCDYFINDNLPQIFELNVKKNPFYSWLQNDHLIHGLIL